MSRTPRKRGPKPTRVDINVTLNDLWDIVTCIHHAYAQGMGYGHKSRHETNIQAANRKRLELRLEKLALSIEKETT